MPDARVHLVHHPEMDELVRHVFDQLADHQKDWPGYRAFVLVPEYLKADMERRYITSQRAGGLMMAEILSFRRFAARIFGEAGDLAGAAISKAGKAVLVQKSLLDQELPFRRFNRLAGKPRYAAELVNVLGDFHRYGISSSELLIGEDEAKTVPARQSTVDKLHDFACLKDALNQELRARELDDSDQDLNRLAELLDTTPLPPRLGFLHQSRVWILGFGNSRDFTSQERQLLKSLSSVAASLTIAIAADYGSENEMAYKHGIESLASLERFFPRVIQEALPDTIPPDPPDYHFIRSIDRRTEVSFAANEIRRLLLTGDVRRRDIGIALCETEVTASYLEPAFEALGIDAYIDTGRPLHYSSFIRFLRSWLSLCDRDFELEDLLEYYRSGLSGLDNQTVDLFENHALAKGWRGAADLRKILTQQDPAAKEVAGGDSPESDAVTKVLEDLVNLFEQTAAMRGARTGLAKCSLLRDRLFEGDQSAAVLVEKRRDRLLDEGRGESARILVASWNAVLDYLDEAAELLGSARISQAHFSSMLLAGIEGLALASIPTGIDLVRVGTLQQMASWPCRILLILGMTDSSFPPEVKQEGFLLDEERAFLEIRTGKAFPNRSKDQPAAQAWLVHSLVTRPRQALYLSTPTLGESSSRLYDEWLQDKQGEELILIKEPSGLPGDPDNWQRVANRLDREIPQALQSADRMAESFALPEPVIESALTLRDGISVSMLQLYNACPFRFFVEYLVGASERPVARDQANLQGVLLHRVMELAAGELIHKLDQVPEHEKSLIILAWQDQLTGSYMRQLYKRAALDRRLAWYGQPRLSGGIGERIIRRAADNLGVIAEFNHKDQYRPRRLEWYFPNQGHPAYRLIAAGHDFICRGLIDRVDENPKGFLRLIDYKRSSREFSWPDLYDGTDLQLPLYKKAYEAAFPGDSVQGLLYAGWRAESLHEFSLFRPPVDKGIKPGIKALEKQMKIWEGDRIEKVAQFAETKAIETLETMMKGRFPAQPAKKPKDKSPCAWCPWYAACGYDKRLPRNQAGPTGRDETNRIRDQILQTGGQSG